MEGGITKNRKINIHFNHELNWAEARRKRGGEHDKKNRSVEEKKEG